MACDSTLGFPLLGECKTTDWVYYWSVRWNPVAQFDTSSEFTEDPRYETFINPYWYVYSVHRATSFRYSVNRTKLETSVSLVPGRWRVKCYGKISQLLEQGRGWDFSQQIIVDPYIDWYFNGVNVGESEDGSISLKRFTINRFASSWSESPWSYFTVFDSAIFEARVNSTSTHGTDPTGFAKCVLFGVIEYVPAII